MKTEKQMTEMKRKIDDEIRTVFRDKSRQYQKEFDTAFGENTDALNYNSVLKAQAKIEALKELAGELGYDWKNDIASSPLFIRPNVIKLPTNTVKGLLK